MTLKEKLKRKYSKYKQEKTALREEARAREKKIKAKEKKAYYKGLEKGRVTSARKRGEAKGKGGGGVAGFLQGVGEFSKAFAPPQEPRRKKSTKKRRRKSYTKPKQRGYSMYDDFF